MKEVNAYYRKHKALDGCPELTPSQIEKIKAEMDNRWCKATCVFEPYKLTNNSAEIRRLKKRLESLKAIKAEDSTETRYDDLGLTVKMNTEAVRIQLFFDDKPDADVRDIVKSRGFHWAKTIGCWQRQITSNGKYALEKMIDELKELEQEGE